MKKWMSSVYVGSQALNGHHMGPATIMTTMTSHENVTLVVTDSPCAAESLTSDSGTWHASGAGR